MSVTRRSATGVISGLNPGDMGVCRHQEAAEKAPDPGAFSSENAVVDTEKTAFGIRRTGRRSDRRPASATDPSDTATARRRTCDSMRRRTVSHREAT